MSSERRPRGRVGEPTWEKPQKLIFGQTILCRTCKGKGKKGKNICGACGGNGVLDEGPRDHDRP